MVFGHNPNFLLNLNSNLLALAGQANLQAKLRQITSTKSMLQKKFSYKVNPMKLSQEHCNVKLEPLETNMF